MIKTETVKIRTRLLYIYIFRFRDIYKIYIYYTGC